MEILRVRGGRYGEHIEDKDEPRGDWMECA